LGRTELGRLVKPGVVAAALAIFPFVVKDPFWQNVAILVLIFATAATAWAVLGGSAGQISFGHSLFFSVGAYTTAYVVIHPGFSPWLGMAAGALLAAVIGTVIGFPFFRLRSHYFSIATIAMQQVAFVLVTNTKELGEASGLALPLRSSSLANLQFSIRDKTEYYLVALAIFGAGLLLVWLVLRGPIGYYLRAIRDDEGAAQTLGVRARRHKLYAMALSAAITAFAGGYYAMYALFVDPSVVLGVGFSILIALAAILGGATSLWGPLIGAAILVLLQQFTRTMFSGAGTGLDFVIYGILVMLIGIAEPRGLAGLAGRLRRRRPA
jgi:branched-chain amino acid transport system permease protein